MQSTKQVVVDLKIMSADATKNIQDLNVKIGNLKATLDGMKKAGLQNSEQYIKLSAVLKEMQQSLKANEKALVENIKEQKASGDSVNAMRAQLKLLRQEYEDLSKAEREGIAGKEMLQNIDDLTTSIKKLEFAQQDYSRQVGEYDVMSKPARQALREMKMECQNLAVALQTTDGKIKAQELIVQSLGSTLGTTNQEYKDAVDELNRLNAAYDTTQKELTEMEQKAGELSDTLADSNQRIKSFANDEQKIAAMQDGVNLLTSAFTVLQSSMASLGVESKSLLEIYAKIQIVQQSLNSLMTIYKALNKDSNLMIMARMKLEQVRLGWTRAYNTALAAQNAEVAKNTVAEATNAGATVAVTAAEAAATPATFSLTAAFAALNTVLKANPIIAIASAIVVAGTAIVGVIKKITKANREEAEAAKKAKEAEEERMKAARERISEQAAAITKVTSKYEEEIAKIRTLINVSESETASYEAKKKAIEELNRIVPQFNGAIDETGRLIRGNTAALENYINTLYQKANAEAYYDILVDTYKQMAQLQNEFNVAVAELGRLQDEVDPSLWRTNSAIVEQTKLVDELQKKMMDYQQTVWQVEQGAATAVAAGAFTTGSGSGKGDKSDKDKSNNEIEAAKKMYLDLQKAAREYYDYINRLHADALQKRINEENDRYMNELDTLTTAYTNAIDLSLKGDDFLKKAGIDPEALQRYITELSNAMDEATRRNKDNVKKIKQDWEDTLKAVGLEADRAFSKLTEKLQYEINKENATGISALRVELDHQLKLLDEQMEAELAAKEYTETQKTEIARLYAERREQIVKNEVQAEKKFWIDQAKTTLGAMADVTGAFSNLFTTLAGNDEKYQKYANALSFVDIMTNMAVGIAEAVSSGAGMPFPYNLAAIAAGIAAVVSGIASAISLFKKNDKVGNAPKFAHGGLIDEGEHGIDKVHIMATRGEYVISKKKVDEYGEDFFDSINFGLHKPVIDGIHFATGGLVSTLNTPQLNVDSSINYDLMREVMADAVSEIQPVVSVKEITSKQNRVKVKERTASL